MANYIYSDSLVFEFNAQNVEKPAKIAKNPRKRQKIRARVLEVVE